MRRSLWLRVLSWVTLATLAVVVPAPSHAQDGESRLERQMAASAARQAREAERARVARQRWEQERRRSAAHARMPDTMYASTPSAPAVELSCPVVRDDDVRRAVQGWGDEVSSSPYFSEDLLAARNGGVFPAPPLQGMVGGFGSSGDDASVESVPHDAWSAAVATASNADTPHLVPLFQSASDAALQGFVRVINHSGDSGEVQIDAVDDTGVSYGSLTLSIDATETVHFNSDDLEGGNTGKGLTGSTGAGEGDWRLTLTSDLDVEVLSYIRTTDGFLTAMHDLAPESEEGVHRIAIFNPGSNTAQVSRLRLINPGEEAAEVAIEGVDDRGMSPGSAVEVTVAAGATQTLTAAELESGGTGMTGALGDGAGKWRLTVRSDASIHALSLLSSPTGHLTNLSTARSNLVDGVHAVALFPSASDASGRQGFVRVINRSESTAEITIGAHDETDWTYDPLTLSLQGGQVAHFNSDDLEQGNAGKGLTGSTGAGEGDWRLELSSDSDIEVLSYIRTTDGFLTAMHDVAPVSGTRHRVAIFNPGSNTAQVSRLRLVNAGEETAAVTIVGTDDQGLSPGGEVLVTVPAGGTRTYTAQELEEGAEGLEGALADGAGKWRLEVTSDVPIRVLSLLSSPTGHLTNLSTAPQRGAGPVATAEELFRTLISGPILQTKCINCHVEGGVSGNTRLVFVTDADADHLATNLSVFEDFLAEVEDGADLILNKIQGALGHGGGIQVAAGTDEFSGMERFLGLLAGEEVAPVTITPANLFNGVKMASRRNVLRRAAIIFAGRIPTDEEYASIRSASAEEFRAAIRNLMQGPEFHEFLIRASNDRLLTDRDLNDEIIARNGLFVDLTNKLYRLIEAAGGDVEAPEAWSWMGNAQHGAGRAPLELIAHVAKNDLPYSEILTADYIMANPMAAEAYGAETIFDDLDNVNEFKPSEIISYYRDDESKKTVVAYEQFTILHVQDPGNLITDYPHAGILNTTAFLYRYPTTATNRNRARSRWTYYHFLGVDIEKSASRTTDPVALSDTNNPTMHNPACTVCHTMLDPVAGAFQNYGDEGLYRDQWGGLDSLDGHYKDGTENEALFSVSARSMDDKETLTRAAWLAQGRRAVAFAKRSNHNIHVDYLTVRSNSGVVISHHELEESDDEECGSAWTGIDYEVIHCPLVVSVDIALSGVYHLETAAYVGYDYADVPGQAATLAILAPYLYQQGDTWYRDMRAAGFAGELVPDADNSLKWLANRIVADERFAEATVKFWWPAIMGRPIAEAPEGAADAGFDGLLLASNAQSGEVARLARGFRRGFDLGTARPYNLKDLLVEIVLSRWFRSHSVGERNLSRDLGLLDAGAQRLLTPEELARKTLAVSGFRWGREGAQKRHAAWQSSLLTDVEDGYGLLFGGIDSDGVTDRAGDLTSMMAGVASTHAVATSCPVVMREFFLLEEEDRRLFRGLEETVSPVLEFSGSFEIVAVTDSEAETVSVEGNLPGGEAMVVLAFVNDFYDDELGDRNVVLDRLTMWSGEEVVGEWEVEDLVVREGCHHNVGDDALTLYHGDGLCTLIVPVHAPLAGVYRFDVRVWGDQAGDELPRLEITVGSDTERSVGSARIRAKLVELYEKLHGIRVTTESAEVAGAYDLFVDVWTRKRASEYSEFDNWREGIDCDWPSDQYYLDGIVEDANWDWERIHAHFETIDWSDRHGVARTWVVVLAYLMMDYRYLYL